MCGADILQIQKTLLIHENEDLVEITEFLNIIIQFLVHQNEDAPSRAASNA